ncbi:MAG: MmgE/PrpD family protein [Chloroflexi bacterium]|nr:MmgE/PrpD family protein [Chloroflexota bacterium]
MGEHVERLAGLVAETGWEGIPAAVREHAKLVLLDTIGVILAGSQQPEVTAARSRLLATGGSGATVYAQGFPTSDPRTAALLNGIAGRSIELCEGHRYVSCQGAVQIVPTVLAVGEQVGASGRDALLALIVGYDAAVRIGAGSKTRALAHQNGQWPMLGAVAAGARLRGLDAATTSLALRIGATLVLVPSYLSAVAGATTLNVAGGMSGFAGTLVAELALAGFAARPNAIEEAFGSLVADGFTPERVTEELGTRWEIGRNYFRLRACCNPTYPSLDALEDALADLKPQPEEIERIDVETYQFASVMAEPNPANYFASKYSLPHAAAATIVRGNAGYGSFTEEARNDPRIVSLRGRVHIKEDPKLTKIYPKEKQGRVTLTLKDGRRTTKFCENARGDFQRPYQVAEVRAKFRELAALVLTPAGVERTEKLVDRFDDVAQVAELVSLLREQSL